MEAPENFQGDEGDDGDDQVVGDDDFREFRLEQQQRQQQQLLLHSSNNNHQQGTMIAPTASKTIQVATSKNSSSSSSAAAAAYIKQQRQQQQDIVDVSDELTTGSVDIQLSLDNTTTDIQMPPSNAVSYLSDHDFLEQEYNDNHHNHYSTDESDDEPLSAEDNPMKLFESIQALARSLHEDAELFGSLPPKRTLESPIRSLLLT